MPEPGSQEINSPEQPKAYEGEIKEPTLEQRAIHGFQFVYETPSKPSPDGAVTVQDKFFLGGGRTNERGEYEYSRVRHDKIMQQIPGQNAGESFNLNSGKPQTIIDVDPRSNIAKFRQRQGAAKTDGGFETVTELVITTPPAPKK